MNRMPENKDQTDIDRKGTELDPPSAPLPEEGKTTEKVMRLAMIELNDVVVFPYGLATLVVESKAMIALLETIVANERLVALFPICKPAQTPQPPTGISDEKELETFAVEDRRLSSTGTIGRIVKMLRFPDGTVRILVRGLKRIHYEKLLSVKEPYTVKIREIREEVEAGIEVSAMLKNAITHYQEIVSSSPFYPDELRVAVLNIEDNSRLVDMMADTLSLNVSEKIHLLASSSLMARLQILTILLNREVEVLRLGSKIQMQVSNALSKNQRDFFLREQLRMIQKELGEESKNPDIKALEERMKSVKLSEKAEAAVKKELQRLETIPQASAEYSVAHTYVDWILSLPWNVFTEDRIDILEASKILDEDHYDLKTVKDIILDFLSVLQLKKDKKSPILCFIGPPGVGKTSLGQSIAKAMQRKFVRMSLGGIRDEAEIRGHRRTYIGALPGRIIQGLKKAQSANPVFMLDEIDKIGSDFRGDPASALLEVLDPQQNNSFMDHYIELDFDLSSVMFIATGNITDSIPPALLDRMELLYLPGYTLGEKKEIAKRFLVPRQIKDNGLPTDKVEFPEKTVESLIQRYTREAGVRNLERSIAKISRKLARQIVESPKKKSQKKMLIGENSLQKFLGPPKYFLDEAEKKAQIGIATGMAWTSSGGSIIPVEVSYMPGKGNLKLTGSLGEVMKESAETAFSYARSNYRRFKIDSDIFAQNDFHIHIPDGATPKDGPSAGITILTALISSLTKRPVKELVSMTGEITLSGKVTPVGGIKEKVIAAMASGIKTVVIPEKNAKDLDDLPPEAKEKIKFFKIRKVDDALKFVLANSKTESPD